MYKEVTKHIDKLTQEHMRKQKSTPVKAARAIRNDILNESVQLNVLKPIVQHLYYKKVESRVVLLGKTGVGKSTLGNILLGQNDFKVEEFLTSTTAKCQSSEIKVEDIVLQVTDTPGICDTQRPLLETLQEIAKCVALTSPGPHVVLMIFRCDVKFTQEEHDAYEILKELFKGAVCNHIILVFTHSDHLTTKPGERQNELEKFLKKSNQSFLNKLLTDCSGRCFAVENRADPEDQKKQRANLLTYILKVFRQNGGTYFDNEAFQEISDDMEQRILTRIMDNNVTGEVATRTTRQDIEKAEVWEILMKWMAIVKNVLQKVISVLAGSGIIEVIEAKMCTVM